MEANRLILNWPDFASLREAIDAEQSRCMYEHMLPAAADRAIAGWFYSRGITDLSRFMFRHTVIAVNPAAAPLTNLRLNGAMQSRE